MIRKVFTLILPLLFSGSAFAVIKVQNVKNDRALLSATSEDELHEEQELFVYNKAQKKVAILKILQIKGRQAVALLIKGKAEAGQICLDKNSAPVSRKSNDEEDSPSNGKIDLSVSKQVKESGGFYAGTANATFGASLQVANIATVANMKGSGFNVTGFRNYLLTNDITARIEGGMQQLNAEGATDGGTLACSEFTTANCNINVNYMALYGSINYYFIKSKIKAWIGIGGGNYLPISSSSNALDKSKISNIQAFALEGGMEYHLNRKNFIPFSIQQINFPSSPSVKASILNIRLGYGWSF